MHNALVIVTFHTYAEAMLAHIALAVLESTGIGSMCHIKLMHGQEEENVYESSCRPDGK